jgi:hypothetical protein
MVSVYVVGVLLILGVFWLMRSKGSDITEMPRPSDPRPPPKRAQPPEKTDQDPE